MNSWAKKSAGQNTLDLLAERTAGIGANVNEEMTTEEIKAEDISTENSGAENQQSNPINFNDFLKDKENQAEFDRRISKALETAKEKWEKQAEMTAEERAATEYQDKIKELENREKAQDRREFIADVKEDLIKNNLPTTFADLIADGTDREQYENVLKGIKTEWDKQITEQIKAIARQTEPQATSVVQGNAVESMADFAKETRKVK